MWIKKSVQFIAFPLCALGILLISSCGSPSGNIVVPIVVENAGNLGSLHLELVYDAEVLEPVEVKVADLAKTAIVQENTHTAGRLIVGIVDDSGISGNGVLVEVMCTVIEKDGNTARRPEPYPLKHRKDRGQGQNTPAPPPTPREWPEWRYR